MRRTIALSVMVAALLIACSRPDRPAGNGSTAGGPPAEGDWVIIRYDSEPENLNPLDAANRKCGVCAFRPQFLADRRNADAIQHGRLDDHKAAAGGIVPEVSPDHLTYTYTLRDGVKWHDGKPLPLKMFCFPRRL